MQESTPSGPCGHLLFWILFGFIICTPLLSIIRALCSRMPGSKFAHSCDWCACILNAFGPLYAMLNCFQMLRSIASECSQHAHWPRRRYLLSPSAVLLCLAFLVHSLGSLFCLSPKFKTIAVSPTSAWPSICVSIACKLRYSSGKSISACHMKRPFSLLTLLPSSG